MENGNHACPFLKYFLKFLLIVMRSKAPVESKILKLKENELRKARECGARKSGLNAQC